MDLKEFTYGILMLIIPLILIILIFRIYVSRKCHHNKECMKKKLLVSMDEVSNKLKFNVDFIKNNMKATGNSRDEIIGYIDDFVKEFENSVLQFGKLAPDTGGLYSRGKITIDPTNPYLTKNKVLGTLEHEIEHMFSDAARQGSDLYKHPVFKLVDRTGRPDEALVKNISQPFEQQVRFRKALSWLEKNAGLKPRSI